ncbi:hypothetical protein [Aquimarina sp. RZ0]|nr:hypothetical protein [Aquimarina sp. RZ0]
MNLYEFFNHKSYNKLLSAVTRNKPSKYIHRQLESNLRSKDSGGCCPLLI